MSEWWTAADAAELDVLLWKFVRVHAIHKPRCEECSHGRPWCDRLAASFDAVLEWKQARDLRSKAAWLRLRELEREHESGRIHVLFDEHGEITGVRPAASPPRKTNRGVHGRRQPRGGGVTPKHSVQLAELLNAALMFVRTYVVLPPAQAVAVALWIVHTHVVDAFETTPFLAVTSPEKRCGKSRLLDVLELLVAKPWRTIMPTEAVLFRKIDAAAPTLMLDETDAIFNAKNANTEPLRAVLNAGNRRGTHVPRCVGPTQQLVDFSVFCPKALAGIGTLPDTIADRAIPIRLARKRPDETAARFRRREADAVAEPIRQELASWAQDAVASLEQARPAVPDALDDRAEEAWEPLLAIADLAGSNWPERARTAAVHLSGSEDRDDDALGVKLLADIRNVFAAAGTERLASADLASALGELEESPWGDLWGKTLDARGLAKRLKPFAVRPRTVRFDDNTTAKGYHRDQFADAFSRYLVESIRHNDTTRMGPSVAADLEPSNEEERVSPKPAPVNGCDGVTDRSGKGGARRVLLPGEPGYPLRIAVALAGGNITEQEHDELALCHRRDAQRRDMELREEAAA